MCISKGNFDSIFFSELRPFELKNLAKMKDTTQNSLSAQLLEAPQQNFMKLCSYEGLNGRCTYPQEMLIQFFGE